jgi:hypothetical protein
MMSASLHAETRPVMIEKNTNGVVDEITGRLRPVRSAIGPVAIAAIINPTKIAEKIGLKALSGMWRDCKTECARNPILCA